MNMNDDLPGPTMKHDWIDDFKRGGSHMNTRHAVVDRIIDPDDCSLAYLCSVAESNRMTHLWIMPSAGITPNKAWFEAALADWDLLPTWQWGDDAVLDWDTPNLLVSCTGCRKPKGGQHWFTICFVAQTQWSWAADDLTPAAQLDIVGHLETSLGVPIGAGPTTVGTKLLQEIHRRRPTLIAKPETDLSAIPFSQACHDLIWQRPLTIAELAKGWLHKFDKNSAYLRACQEETFGVGEPRAFTLDTGLVMNKQFDLPGIWKIAIYEMPRRPLLPPLLWDNHEWVSTPILKMLKHAGVIFGVEVGGWFSPACAHTLRPWAEKLWNSRSAFMHEGKQDEAGAIKDIYTSAEGLFGSEIVKGTWKYRPDWWCQIKGGAYSLMFYNMLKFAAESGAYPIMVYMDALFYISDEEAPESAVRGILDHRYSLGGYKHEWTLPLQDYAVREVLDSNLGLALKIGRLNDLAEEYRDEND